MAAPPSADSDEAIRMAASEFLRNRGFNTQAQLQQDVKINELLHRDYKKAPRFGLNVVPKAGDTYGASYVRLCAWINARPDALKKEIAHLRFPIFVHCFLGLLVQANNGGDRDAPSQFLKAHVPEHAQMNQPEKKKQLEQLIPLASTTALKDSPLANLYFTQRISWTCSQASFEAVTNFLVDEQLHLLLRVLVLYFNIHAVRRDPPELTQPASVHSLIGHTGPVYSCAISRDCRFVLSGGQDGVARLWAARHAQCLVNFRSHGHPILHLGFSPHNAHFLTSCYDGGVRLFTTERRAPLRVLAGHQSEVDFSVFHPNGAYALSCSSDHTMRLWDISSPACIRLFYGHKAPVTCAAISNDGFNAASASDDGTVKLWQLGSAKCWATVPLPDDGGSPVSVSFSSSGRLLACASERAVNIWELRELRELTSKPDAPPIAPTLTYATGMPLMSAAFVPQHQVLLAAGVELSDAMST